VDIGNRSAPVIRFGVFEVDLQAEELRKNGLKLRLRGQPFQALAMLVEGRPLDLFWIESYGRFSDLEDPSARGKKPSN